MGYSGAQIRWKTTTGIECRPLEETWLQDLRGAEPWRTLRSVHGQPHFAGSYWSVTTGGLVTYESRLELSRLLIADWDRDVVWIISQPFLIEATDSEGRKRRHIPDFLLLFADGSGMVVNVKPRDRLANPRIAAALAWPQELFVTRGWRTEVWSEAPAVRLANIRYQAGYRRADRCDSNARALVRELAPQACSVGELEDLCASRFERELVRPALLHAVWNQELYVDVDLPIEPTSALGVSR